MNKLSKIELNKINFKYVAQIVSNSNKFVRPPIFNNKCEESLQREL